MSDEDLEVVVSQEVLLGQPGLEDDVTGQPSHLLTVPLPDDGVLQLGERFQEHGHLLLPHLTRFDRGPEGDIDDALGVAVKYLLEVGRKRPTLPAVDPSHLFLLSEPWKSR